ncbi:MAG: hypothetical protein A3J51_04385 [Omnitrophica WOR_2 bacterium RIFCSPHIGHO2_02_FULL_45_21]|nr:MAG: hypothetical protein A3J51_04385 [Omnitrophica WOR_2 bacterium RIFCSPHIGHO2_02_FULL_45_21]
MVLTISGLAKLFTAYTLVFKGFSGKKYTNCILIIQNKIGKPELGFTFKSQLPALAGRRKFLR